MEVADKGILEARLFDAVSVCQKRSIPKFVGFLEASGAAAALTVAKSEKAKFLLWGGYEAAERVYFGVFPDWCEPDASYFPIVKLRIINKSTKVLEHRDILGALMSAGIERDTVGDILTEEKQAFVFIAESVADHIINETTKIASAGVELVRDDTDYVPLSNSFLQGSDTVASSRVDCVVSALANCSRNTASELISAGLVSINGIMVQKVTKEVSEGDVLAVRKKGKFVIDGINDLTKKGRIVLKYRKYN